jgi:DNA-directed RNA polymerase I, II, and III subunit RPABC1
LKVTRKGSKQREVEQFTIALDEQFTMALDEQTNKLFRIRRTVLQMLNDRDYLVGDFEINTTKEQFLDKFGEDPKKEDLVINKAKRNSPSEQVTAFINA